MIFSSLCTFSAIWINILCEVCITRVLHFVFSYGNIKTQERGDTDEELRRKLTEKGTAYHVNSSRTDLAAMIWITTRQNVWQARRTARYSFRSTHFPFVWWIPNKVLLTYGNDIDGKVLSERICEKRIALKTKKERL